MSNISQLQAQKLGYNPTIVGTEPNFVPAADRQLVLMDPNSGEIFQVYKFDPRKTPKESDWIKLYQRAMLAVTDKWEITGFEARVLWRVMAVLGYKNCAVISHRKLAKDWDLKSTADISKAFKKLESLRIVECLERSTKGNVYRLNPNYGWKGEHAPAKVAVSTEMDARRRSRQQKQTEPTEPATSGLFHARAIGEQ